ncbi:MAG: dihydrolipoyl dehydrogenase [Hyphomicrobiales bacterium]|nr:dihydrolipoyl dehydrogenase [Hyphomicrobiales bacterium]
MEHISCDVLVVGGGPGGYVAAIRASKLGKKVILVEADRMGGTCLIRGCIPSKAIIHAAGQYAKLQTTSPHSVSELGIDFSQPVKLDYAKTQGWKDSVVNQLSQGVEGLLKRAGVTVIKGWAKFHNAKACMVETKDATNKIETLELTAEHVILATGSKIMPLPSLPFGGKVIDSTEALCLQTVPKTLAIIGAGYIGVELGLAYAKLGSKVSFVEMGDAILPSFDKQLVRPVVASLKKYNVDIFLNSSAIGLNQNQQLEIKSANDDIISLDCDKILVTIGRQANLFGWGLEHMGVDLTDDKKFIKIDNKCRTSMRNVWAIGDIVGEPMLEHKATTQGEIVSEIITGKTREFAPTSIAAICFTDPEIVSVGMTLQQAKDKNIEVKIGNFPFVANGRALSQQMGGDGGFVRVIARADNHLILGIQAVGAHISELAGEFALALEMSARLEDIADTIHAHPTMGEAFMESAMMALGEAIHI